MHTLPTWSRIIFGVCLSGALLLGCGKKGEAEGEAESSAKESAAKSKPKRPFCAQRTQVKARIAAADGIPTTTAVKSNKAIAWTSGRRHANKPTVRLVHVAYGNYDVKLGAGAIVPPAKPEQVAVVMSIKTADRAARAKGAKQAKQADAPSTVPTGAFSYGVDAPGNSYFITVYSGGAPEAKVLWAKQLRGKAILTHSSPNHLCGSFGFRSGNGTFIKGTFNLPVAKNLGVSKAKP